MSERPREPNPEDDGWFRHAYDARNDARALTGDPETMGPDEFREYSVKFAGDRRRERLDREADPDLEEFSVNWHAIDDETVDGLRRIVDESTDERTVTAFLKEHPALLVLHLSGGHGRWVLPGTRFGAEHVADFMIAEKSSVGFEWYAVELEPVGATLFTQAGDPSAKLTHALRQIADWRRWLGQNLAQAERLRSDKGLGLRDIDPQVPGLIVLGRSGDAEAGEVRARRRQMAADNRVAIRSYDWLLERAIASLRQSKKFNP